MPVYKTARHGVSYSEALHEAAAIAPLVRAMLNTFELYHPLGTPGGPIYVVNNYEAFIGTKEPGASRDAGVAVTYMASNVTIGRPEESASASTPEIALSLSNVSGFMSDALRLARGSIVSWEIIERVYASDDPTRPAIIPPMSLIVTGVDIDGEVVTLRASFGDPANISIPRVTFKRSQYPGLVR